MKKFTEFCLVISGFVATVIMAIFTMYAIEDLRKQDSANKK